jgi:hypothetical protein
MPELSFVNTCRYLPNTVLYGLFLEHFVCVHSKFTTDSNEFVFLLGIYIQIKRRYRLRDLERWDLSHEYLTVNDSLKGQYHEIFLQDLLLV